MAIEKVNSTLKCSYAKSRRQAPTTPLGILSFLTYETRAIKILKSQYLVLIANWRSTLIKICDDKKIIQGKKDYKYIVIKVQNIRGAQSIWF